MFNKQKNKFKVTPKSVILKILFFGSGLDIRFSPQDPININYGNFKNLGKIFIIWG